MSRIEAIRKVIAQSPSDPFPRYALAMELKNAGQGPDAEAAFAELASTFPDYVPQYLMRGQLLLSLGKKADAESVFTAGIAAAQKKGDGHALGELTQALDTLRDD